MARSQQKTPQRRVPTGSRASRTTEMPASHPVKSLHEKIESEFKKPLAAKALRSGSVTTDFEDFLIRAGIGSGEKRRQLVSALLPVFDLAKRGHDLKRMLDALQGEMLSTPTMPLPPHAPKLYAERVNKTWDIVAFLRDPEGWFPWIESRSLTRAQFKKYDPDGYQALANWLQKHKRLPRDLEMPTRSEVIDRLAQARHLPTRLAHRVER